MDPFAVLGWLWRLQRRQKLGLTAGMLLSAEAAGRILLPLFSPKGDPAAMSDLLAALPPGISDAWARVVPFLGYIEPTAAVLVVAYSVGLLLWQLWWRLKTWPAAQARWARPGYLLEVLPPADQALRSGAMEGLLGQVFALLQADGLAVLRGKATTLSLEYWSGAAGTGLYCRLPASADERLLAAFAAQLRAACPGVRLRQTDDPLRARLLAAEQRELVLGVCEYGLRAHSDFPLRDPADFPADPLATLVGALQVEPSTPLVGLEIVLTAYNGAWRDDVARRIDGLRARELTAKRKAALPATHAAEVRALGRQSDQLGFDTLVRTVVLGADKNAGPAVRARLERITRQLEMYDAVTGKVRQGLVSTASNVGSVNKPGDNGTLPAWARGALDRWPRPLSPLGRRLFVLGARELATLWHLPAKELIKLPGLNCWQRAQVFPVPNGALVPGGVAAREWMITGVAPRELTAITASQQYVGIRRAALNQHVYVNGPTRSGKTKLLENMTRQDLEGGWGVGVIDPKGDYARKTILMVPWEREGQVCYFDPLDTSRRIMGVNPLERIAVARLGRDVVQSGAVGILGSLGAGWEAAPLGKRFMQHALALLLDAEPEPTFLHLYRLLQHSKEGNPYREELLAQSNPATAQNYSVVAADFWANQVPSMKESQLNSLQTALTRTESFLSNERVLQIIAQPASTFNLRRMMDEQGIFVASVTAELGGDLQRFVGTLLMTLITQAGFSRNDLAEGERPFWRLTVDEFQKFIAMSGSAEAFEDLLSMLGGLGVGLTMAHQAFKQLSPDLLGIILGNVGTRIFYPSQEDAAAIATRLGGQVRRDDQLYLERFWTTQVLPMATGSSGPVTVAPLPLAVMAATPQNVPAPDAAALADWTVRCWGRVAVSRDELASGRLRDLTSAAADEDEAARWRRMTRLVELFYGAERDSEVLKTLCSLDAADFALYTKAYRLADRHLRELMLAQRRLCGAELDEATKLRRIATLSDLAYGTPAVEVRARIARVMGQGLVESKENNASRPTARDLNPSRPAGQLRSENVDPGGAVKQAQPTSEGHPLADTVARELVLPTSACAAGSAPEVAGGTTPELCAAQATRPLAGEAILASGGLEQLDTPLAAAGSVVAQAELDLADTTMQGALAQASSSSVPDPPTAGEQPPGAPLPAADRAEAAALSRPVDLVRQHLILDADDTAPSRPARQPANALVTPDRADDPPEGCEPAGGFSLPLDN